MPIDESLQVVLRSFEPRSSVPLTKQGLKLLLLRLGQSGKSFNAEEVEQLVTAYGSISSAPLSLTGFADWLFEASHDLPLPECRVRILHVNDVYKLDNFPTLKTAVDKLSVGFPPQNVITTLAGDFLAPSLLSSIDQGRAMVDVMNRVPIKVVCFGNHESDVPYPSLVKRITEFKGSWLNSNMRDFKPELPDNLLIELEGGRTLGLLGFNIGGGIYSSTYREGALGGYAKSIVPVLDAVDAAIERCRLACPNVDAIIPLTHQDMPDDVALAKRGLFPVILGGHDHDAFHEIHSGCHVVKAGADAEKVACIDVVWPEGVPRTAFPQVSVKLIPLEQVEDPVSKFEPDAELNDIVQQAYQPVRELEEASLAKFPPGKLSSKSIRFGPSSFAAEICNAMRSAGRAQGAIMTSGSIRGDKLYDTGLVTYGDLAKECPFPSANLVVAIPGSVLREAIAHSRKAWSSGESDGQSLQVDIGMKMDENGLLCEVAGKAFDAEGVYEIVVDSYILTSNPVLKAFAEANPQLIPPSDAGLPALPMLCNYFCTLAWEKLANFNGDNEITTEEANTLFDMYEADGDGYLHQDEVMVALRTQLPHMAHKVIARKLMSCLDVNGDGKVSRSELCRVIVHHLTEDH